MTKIYHSCQIANWFVRRAHKDKKKMTVMLLMKLAYFAHGWRLEMKNTPLFHDRIEAWRYGPVILDIYDWFKHQDQNLIVTKLVPIKDDGIMEDEDIDLLEQIWQVYGNLSSRQLSDLMRIEGGPWDITMKNGGFQTLIPNDLIRQHHILKRNEANKQNNMQNLNECEAKQ